MIRCKTTLFLLCLIPLMSCQRKRDWVLFNIVDRNNNLFLENREIYRFVRGFDSNSDQSITEEEFTKDWVEIYRLGAVEEAKFLFPKVDMDNDSVISNNDVDNLIKFFDVSESGEVSWPEFAVQSGPRPIIK